MSSCVIVRCTQGFVISTDGIAFKQPVADAAQMFGRVKGLTRKLFQLTDDVVVAGVGDFTSYLPVFNAAARLRLPTAKLVAGLLDLAVQKAADSRIFVVYRDAGNVFLDVCELGHVRRDQPGAVAYPNPLLNGLFLRVHESPEGKAVSTTGMLGMTALVSGFNALASSLSAEMSPPFDTVCFLADGMFVVSGGITKLPVAEFW
jgi:hypothetical protein